MLNALWTNGVLSKQCQTCIEVKLPISASLCETKLWQFCQVSYPCTSRQMFGPWSHVGIKCYLPKFLVDHPIDVKNVFHQHLIVIKVAYYGPHKCQGMWSKWKVCLMAMLWIYNVLFERWQWLQIMKQSWKRILLWILSFDYGPSLALLLSSNTSSQN